MRIDLDAIQKKYPRPESRAEVLRAIRMFCEENNLNIHPSATINPGDFYVGIRNTGPHLLECRAVMGGQGGWIAPTCSAYPYDKWECVKVSLKDTHEVSDIEEEAVDV